MYWVRYRGKNAPVEPKYLAWRFREGKKFPDDYPDYADYAANTRETTAQILGVSVHLIQNENSPSSDRLVE